MSSISSFDIVGVVVLEPRIFLCIPASTAATAALNSNVIKTFLAYIWSRMFIKGKPVLVMDQEVYQNIHSIVLFLIVVEFMVA